MFYGLKINDVLMKRKGLMKLLTELSTVFVNNYITYVIEIAELQRLDEFFVV